MMRTISAEATKIMLGFSALKMSNNFPLGKISRSFPRLLGKLNSCSLSPVLSTKKALLLLLTTASVRLL